MTKPGQSQTVNIARTISAVSSAVLFLPGILVRPEPRAGQTIRVASEPADVVTPSVLLMRSDHRSTAFSKMPPIHSSNPEPSNKSCRPAGVRSPDTKIPRRYRTVHRSLALVCERGGERFRSKKATVQATTIPPTCSALPSLLFATSRIRSQPE